MDGKRHVWGQTPAEWSPLQASSFLLGTSYDNNSFSSPQFMITKPIQNHQDYVNIDMAEDTLIWMLFPPS